MKLIKVLTLALVCATTIPTVALAGSESGFYVGAGVGQSSVGDIDPDNAGSINFSGDDTGWKVFGGYNFGLVPFLDLAIEGGYVDFGSVDDSTVSSGKVSIDANGFDIFGLVGVKLGPVGIFGKVGAVNWDADVSANNFSDSESGTDPAYGAGLRFKIGSVEIRGEYEYFDVENANNVSLLSASGVWTF